MRPPTLFGTRHSAVVDRREIYDSLVVGGGPAGLTAAIYLARFNRSVIVIDMGVGRSTTHELNENYLGFPEGIESLELRERGRQQAERFGAQIVRGRAASARAVDGCYEVACDDGTLFAGRTLILATGVVDRFPEFEHLREYVGRSLFWCITCDGYKVRDRRVVVVGPTDSAVTTCMQFLNFTGRLAFLTNRDPGTSELSERSRRNLAAAGIPLYEAQIVGVEGDDGMMRRIDLADGCTIEADFMFSQQGASPNVDLAASLGASLSPKGYVLTDDEQRTGVPRLYAAGDVTRMFAHQIVTAAHEGATAGQAANYDLYRPEQRD